MPHIKVDCSQIAVFAGSLRRAALLSYLTFVAMGFAWSTELLVSGIVICTSTNWVRQLIIPMRRLVFVLEMESLSAIRRGWSVGPVLMLELDEGRYWVMRDEVQPQAWSAIHRTVRMALLATP